MSDITNAELAPEVKAIAEDRSVSLSPFQRDRLRLAAQRIEEKEISEAMVNKSARAGRQEYWREEYDEDVTPWENLSDCLQKRWLAVARAALVAAKE